MESLLTQRGQGRAGGASKRRLSVSISASVRSFGPQTAIKIDFHSLVSEPGEGKGENKNGMFWDPKLLFSWFKWLTCLDRAARWVESELSENPFQTHLGPF